MFQQPAENGDKAPIPEMVGSLVLFVVREYKTGVVTTFGEKDCVAADVHCLDGPHGGEVFDNALLFQGALIGSLKGAVNGEPVLARIGIGTGKPGQNPPYVLLPFTDADVPGATAYWQRYTAPALQQPAAAPAAVPAPAAPPAAAYPSPAASPATANPATAAAPAAPVAAAPVPADPNGPMDPAAWVAMPVEVQALLRQSAPHKVPAGY